MNTAQLNAKLSQNKKLKKISIVVVILSIFFIWMVSAIVTHQSPEEKAAKEQQAITAEQTNVEVLTRVQSEVDAWDDDTRTALASTSVGGYQGDIVKIENSNSDGGLKITVSTHFSESGRDNDGGQAIAHKLMGMLCMSVPELKSIYVISKPTGLESKSTYRSDIPACKSVN